MPEFDKSPAPKSRVNFLRRRPRPGGLVRESDDLSLPHERDQAEQGMTDQKPNETMRQAQRDQERGLQDTSKSPEMDRAYQRQK